MSLLENLPDYEKNRLRSTCCHYTLLEGNLIGISNGLSYWGCVYDSKGVLVAQLTTDGDNFSNHDFIANGFYPLSNK